jgi:NAD(P)-dependent dehydrogenase (short-subunit alcohol dehydrogenase family)
MGIFQSKVAIVTGAGNGIGRAEALSLAARGAAIVVNDLGGKAHDGHGWGEHGPADAVVSEIVQGGGRAVANHGDVCDWKTTSGMIEQARSAVCLLRSPDRIPPRRLSRTPRIRPWPRC